MGVRVDHVTNGLARNQLLHLRQHRDAAAVVQRCLDDDHVVLHLDRDTVVRTARDEPYTVGHLFRGHALGGVFHRIRQLDVGRRVRLHFLHREIEYGKPAGCLRDPGREFHAAIVAVLRERRHDIGFAQDRLGNPRFDPVDETGSVDICDRLEPARLRERRGRVGLAVAHFLPHRSVIANRGLDDPLRRNP